MKFEIHIQHLKGIHILIKYEKNLIDRFQLYNKGMKSIDWNDVNVLRKLPDGWYSVPSDSDTVRR